MPDRAARRSAGMVGDDGVGVGTWLGSSEGRRRMVPVCYARPMGLLDGQEGADLRRRQRPFDRLGHRPGVPRGRVRRSASAPSRASSRSGSGHWRRRSDRPSSSRATSRTTTRSGPSSRKWGATYGRARHPRPRPGVRPPRGPRGRVRRHVARRLRPGARRQRVLARRAGPRGAAVPGPRVERHDPDLLRRREGRRQLQRDGRREGGPRGVGPLPRGGSRTRRDPRERDQRRPGPDAGGRRASPGSRRCTARSPTSPRCARTSPRRTSVGRPSTSRSDLSSAVTGEVIYVDGGFNILGVPTAD